MTALRRASCRVPQTPSGRLFRVTMALLLATTALGVWTAAAPAALPPIYHVYEIVLENESASTTFGPASPAPYLSKTLRAEGAYLPNYYGVGHESNDNYIAMISGQAPNAETQSDCQTYGDFPVNATGSFGQAQGAGCLYPSSVPTIASQFGSAGLTWRDYNESMGADPARESAVCGHPGVGSRDNTQSATTTDGYAARHDPFVYFHSIIDDTALCDTHVVNLDALPQDLANPDAPNYAFVTPDLCDDGHDASCAGGRPGGLAAADSFLRTWVPRITGSPGFRRGGGLLIITFDEAATSDTRACCGEIPGPGSPLPGINGPGGGDVGAVLLSPYIAPGTVSMQPYNHYSMLRSVEDLFRLGHIGYAALPGGRSLGSDVFACAPSAVPVAGAGKLPAGSEIQHVRLLRRGGVTQLTLASVGNSALRVLVSTPHRRATVIRRSLVPCRGYAVPLPAGHHHVVSVTASAGGGSQGIALHY